MNPKRIVLTGGPSTGKTSIISELKGRGYLCYDEISRDITRQAQQDGVEQLFLAQPLVFSKRLLIGRTSQFTAAAKENTEAVFLDRGLPDILAYMDYIGDTYPQLFTQACETHRYNKVFILEPWEAIYKTDTERYESFNQAQKIHEHLVDTYKRFGYHLINVPFLTIAKRTDFILDALDL